MNTIFKLVLGGVLILSAPVMAEESTVEKVKDTTSEAYQDTKKTVKKGYRKAKDKTCEMVNGKMECAVKKAGNTINNGVDEVKDKVDDVKKN